MGGSKEASLPISIVSVFQPIVNLFRGFTRAHDPTSAHNLGTHLLVLLLLFHNANVHVLDRKRRSLGPIAQPS